MDMYKSIFTYKVRRNNTPQMKLKFTFIDM